MILYALNCAAGHAFEGWFPGSAAFDTQSAAGQIACPTCGDVTIARALMAPAIARASAPTKPTPPPAEIVAALQKLRASVEKNCDYVGTAFADQARQMHHGTVEARGIYGETTQAEAEALHEEGVEVTRVPWVQRADS